MSNTYVTDIDIIFELAEDIVNIIITNALNKMSDILVPNTKHVYSKLRLEKYNSCMAISSDSDVYDFISE